MFGPMRLSGKHRAPEFNRAAAQSREGFQRRQSNQQAEGCNRRRRSLRPSANVATA